MARPAPDDYTRLCYEALTGAEKPNKQHFGVVCRMPASMAGILLGLYAKQARLLIGTYKKSEQLDILEATQDKFDDAISMTMDLMESFKSHRKECGQLAAILSKQQVLFNDTKEQIFSIEEKQAVKMERLMRRPYRPSRGYDMPRLQLQPARPLGPKPKFKHPDVID